MNRISITTIALLSLTAFAFAQQQQISQPQSAPQPAKSAPSAIVTEDMNPQLKATITMRAQDASLSEVLKILAERTGMNFVTGEGVYKEKITIILNKTPVDQAIDLVVRAAGLSYEIVGNSVLIAEPDKLKDEVGKQGYVIALKYVNADEAKGMLGDLSKNVQVDKGGNKLVCFTSPRVINEIERIVKSIDTPHILVMLETRLIEVKVTSDNKYGIDWARLTPVTSAGSSGSGGTAGGGAAGAAGTAGGTGAASTGTIGTGLLSHPPVPMVTGYNAGSWFLGALNLNIALDLMVSNGDARLLMNSKLTTTNNREATLHIGEVIPYEIQTYTPGASGGGAALQIQKEEVGIKLAMTPTINELNQVTLTLEPEVSSLSGYSPKSNLPITSVRKTKTTVRVEDGQTVFLAGLLREDEVVKIDKVPLLGDIPLLGLLFQHQIRTKQKTNMILEITPTIITNTADLMIGTSSPQGAPADSTKK